jgi:hypothetical protein
MRKRGSIVCTDVADLIILVAFVTEFFSNFIEFEKMSLGNRLVETHMCHFAQLTTS